MSDAGPSKLPIKKTKKVDRSKGSKSHGARSVKKERNADELVELDRALEAYVPPDVLKSFEELPISEKTKRGLKKAFFQSPTPIQSLSVPLALKGSDILASARTGSGKTLAFLIPMLESLYRKRWGPQDGLGALVISPTRELAIQIFEVLRKIGPYHSFSAGLVIGGKNVKDEMDRLTKMNILIATPGRLLQHMDQTVGFECDGLQMLILDEADRILDLGFKRTLNAIMAHLPKTRQTLLFSATQTKSIKDLARLSLKDPVSLSASSSGAGKSSGEAGAEGEGEGEGEEEERKEWITPKGLEQHYAVVELHRKLDVLFSFIKTHLKSKIIVFMSSCKQVRFVYETFCKLHPGTPLLELHGKQKQSKRLNVFQKFTTTSTCCLFATDVAARGLDFPAVDWVIQLDVPEDGETYIHRVGRTARYEAKGQSLMLVLPSEEEGVKAELEKKGVKGVKAIKIRASKTMSISNQLQSFAFQDPELKYLGQRAFISYLKSVYIQSNKSIFSVADLPIELFAESLGLPGAPQVKFVDQELAKKKKNRVKALLIEQESKKKEVVESGDEEETKLPTAPVVRTKYDKMFAKQNQNILSEHYANLLEDDVPSSTKVGPAAGLFDDVGNDDFLTLKRKDHKLAANSDDDDDDASPTGEEVSEADFRAAELSKRKLKMGTSKKAMLKAKGAGHKLVYDADGVAHEIYEFVGEDEELARKKGDEKERFVEQQRREMEVVDVGDREVAKEKKREKKRKRKDREREAEGNGREGDFSDDDDDSDDESDGGEGMPGLDLTGLMSASEESSSDEEDDSDVDMEEEEERPGPAKKQRKTAPAPAPAKEDFEDEEELAMRLLERS